MKKGSKAQSSLEYLMTYGWALVLIISVISILVFIVSSPSSVAFSSSDPSKILMKGGSVSGSDAEIKMQNITGGAIDVTSVSMTSNYSSAGCSLNGAPLGSGGSIIPLIMVPAGGELYIECSNVTGNGSGTITIDYTDQSGLQRTAGIEVSVTGSTDGGETGSACLSGGTGTEDDPIRVTTLAELDNVRNDLSAHYEMCQDIDASATSGWDMGLGFDPLYNPQPITFTGSFDGKGYKITGLYINRPAEDYVGLFGIVGSGACNPTDYCGEILNLGLEGVDITGQTHVGALAGISYGEIQQSYAEGEVGGFVDIGGLVGSNYGSIVNSYAAVDITAGEIIAGFVGSHYGTIENSYSSGDILPSTANATGFAPNFLGGTVTNSWYPDSIFCLVCKGEGSEQYQTTQANLQSQTWLTAPPKNWDFTTVWNINEGTSFPFLR